MGTFIISPVSPPVWPAICHKASPALSLSSLSASHLSPGLTLHPAPRPPSPRLPVLTHLSALDSLSAFLSPTPSAVTPASRLPLLTGSLHLCPLPPRPLLPPLPAPPSPPWRPVGRWLSVISPALPKRFVRGQLVFRSLAISHHPFSPREKHCNCVRWVRRLTVGISSQILELSVVQRD